MRLNKFIGDSFLMILSSGIAQVILIITTPIITRLYSPTELVSLQFFKYRNDFNTNNKCKIRFVDCEY